MFEFDFEISELDFEVQKSSMKAHNFVWQERFFSSYIILSQVRRLVFDN